jgi:hypothetical protein
MLSVAEAGAALTAPRPNVTAAAAATPASFAILTVSP